jgi:hypothetical protein
MTRRTIRNLYLENNGNGGCKYIGKNYGEFFSKNDN